MAARTKRRKRATLKGLYVRRVLARNVERLRKARGMKQEDLADAAHMGQSQISDIENAKTNIQLHILQYLAAGLRADLAELFEEER
jgi:transcriptional regulator with XRE-family HTH domain